MNEEDRRMQKQLVDEMMKVNKTNPDVMIYMQTLMKCYEDLEKENNELSKMCELYSKSLYNADLKRAEKELDQYKNNWEELKKWVKERYEKTEENSSRLTSKDGVPLSQDFYTTVVNIQADRKDILNKMKELEEKNND